MRAAVLEPAEFAVLGARHHHGHGTDEGGAIVADVGNIDLEAEVVPDGTFKQALLFEREHIGVAVDPVWDAGEAFRPDPVGDCVQGTSFLDQFKL